MHKMQRYPQKDGQIIIGECRKGARINVYYATYL